MEEKSPCLLNREQLIDPIAKALKEITRLKIRAESAVKDEILLHGIVVLALAYYEVAIGDSLRYYLRHFPYHLREGEIKFSRDVFITDQFELLERAIDKFITATAYKNFIEYLETFTTTTAIAPNWKNDDLSKVQEFRARRNLLLHNGLVVNNQYQESSGLNTPPQQREKLAIDAIYLRQSLDALLGLLTEIETALATKYELYTRMRAMKELWAYMFKSPVMPFEDFWAIRGDSMYSRTSPHEDALSGGEKLMLGLWRAHFNRQGELLRNFNMRLLDRRNQIKVLQFLAWNREHLVG